MKAAEGVFASCDRLEEVQVVAVKEVEPAGSARSVRSWPRDLLEISECNRGIIDRSEKVQVAAVRGSHELSQIGPTVDRLLDRGDFSLARPVSVFHLPVVLEEGNVVGCGLDAEHQAQACRTS